MNVYIALSVAFLFLSSSILLLFNCRTKLGLAPLCIFLGAIQHYQTSAYRLIRFEFLEENYSYYQSSIIIFSATLFAVLLIYVRCGVSSTTVVIVGSVITNFLFFLSSKILYTQATSVGILNDANVQAFFDINYKNFIIVAVRVLVEGILLAMVYQFFRAKLKKQYYFLLMFISLASVLLFDFIASHLLLSHNRAYFTTSVIGYVAGILGLAFIFSLQLYLYLKFIDKEHEGVRLVSNQKSSIFSIPSNKTKYLDFKSAKKQIEHNAALQLESALAHMLVGFASLDTSWCFTYVNEKAAELLDSERHSLLGKNFWAEFAQNARFPWYDLCYKLSYKAVETQQTQSFKAYDEPLDKWFEISIYPSLDGIRMYFIDVTKQNKVELALNESQQQLKTILEIEPDCILQLNANNQLTAMNPACLAMIQADSFEQAIGKSAHEFVDEEYKESFAKLTADVFKGKSRKLKFSIKGMKGKVRWLEMHAVPLKDTDENIISLLAITRDVSHLKMVDSKNQMLLSLMETSEDFIGLASLEGNPLYLNTNGRMLVGLEAEEKLLASILDFFPTDYHSIIQNEQIPAIFENEKWHGEAYLKNRKTGHVIPIEMSGFLVKDKITDEPLALGIIASDSTERKKAKEQLIKSEQLFRGLSESAPVSIFQADLKGAWNYVNGAWTAYSGLSFNESMGFGWSSAIHPDDADRVIEQWNQCISNESKLILEFRILSKSGETVWFSVQAVGLFDDSNKLYAYVGTGIDITEIKRSEEGLIRSKKYLDNIINTIADPVFVKDDQSRLLLVNDAFCSIFNITRADAIGKTLAEKVSPAERELFLRIDKQVIETGIENVNEETLTLEDSKTSIISTKKSRFVDHSGNKFLIGVIRDITDRYKAEKALKENEEKFSKAFESNVVGKAILNKEKRIIETNQAFTNIIGLTQENILGKTIEEIGLFNLDGQKNQENKNILCREFIQQGHVSNIELNYLLPSGRKLFLLLSLQALQLNNAAHILITVLDTTEKKLVGLELEKYRTNLEELVEIRTSELEKEKIKAQSADLMKSAFLATMSHELRTPMNSIIGFTGILLKEFAGPLNEEQKKQIAMVKTSGQHLLGLINDVLDISKIEAGKLKVSLSPFNYLATLEKTIDFLLPQASKKELHIRTEIAEMNITLNSDEHRVEQVILNLLSNAIKFSSHGVITVQVAVRRGFAVTQIIDQGIGINKNDLDKLFMPFIQLEGGLRRSHEGSGLGLAICKSLIEKLGGTIKVQSKVGKGSNFTFTLPLNQLN